MAGAPTGPCAASVMSIDSRSCLASQGRAMKSKLKAVCISSGRRYCAKRAVSCEPDLADEHARALVGVGHGAPAAVDVVQLVAVDVRVLARARVLGGTSGSDASLTSSAAESMRMPATPRSNQNRSTASNSSTHLRVRPVDVGLLRGEQVQVPLAGGAVGVRRARPGAALEVGDPVRRDLARRARPCRGGTRTGRAPASRARRRAPPGTTRAGRRRGWGRRR